MSERISFDPSNQEGKPETVKKLEITERPEYTLACNNIKNGGDLVKELLRLGVPETELKPFALVRLEKNIRKGYGFEAIRSIAKQAGIITETEVDALFKETQAKMLTEAHFETEEEKAKREAAELEAMLSQYE